MEESAQCKSPPISTLWQTFGLNDNSRKKSASHKYIVQNNIGNLKVCSFKRGYGLYASFAALWQWFPTWNVRLTGAICFFRCYGHQSL